MFKSTINCLAVASMFGAGVAFAADAVEVKPGTGPTDAMTKAVPDMKPAAGQPESGTTKPSAPATTNNSEAAPVSCTQAELTAMITKAGALTDKDKQKMTMGHLQSAKKSMDLKDTAACAMHMKEASANLGTVTK